MTKPAKDEPALLKRAGEAIRKALIKPPGCTESTGCAVGPCHCAHLAAEASIAAIRAAGWAVVPLWLMEDLTPAEADALRVENARLREALAFYVRIRAQPVELVKDFGNTAEAALKVKP